MHSVAGTRYAKALADVVLAPGSNLAPAAVLEQLRGVEEIMGSATELKHIMLSPAVPSSKKRAVIAKLAGALGLSRQVQNFLYVIIDHRRMHQITEIREAFEAAVDEQLGVAVARITSAQPLGDEQRGLLQSEIAKITGKTVRADYAIDDTLIGGLIARIGSTVYDGSVRGRLESLRRALVTEA
jgi:F-type H+-transporting ATPase subunit delta